MQLNIQQAARAVGVARSTLYRDIQNGTVSIGNDGKGRPFVELCELERVYGTVTLSDTSESIPTGHSETRQQDTQDRIVQREMALLREQLTFLQDERNDLRRRLDQEAEERHRLTLMLTDQRSEAVRKSRRGWFVWAGWVIAGVLGVIMLAMLFRDPVRLVIPSLYTNVNFRTLAADDPTT